MIEIKNLCAGYGKKQVLNDFSLKIEKGEILSIIGCNGTGKSTLLKTLAGVIDYEGQILLDTKNFKQMKAKERARKIAYLLQERNIPEMTVKDAVLHGRYPYLEFLKNYSESDVEFARLKMEEMGVIEYSDVPLYKLSGGIKQNVFIAMLLAQYTDYILLDEPITFLDISNRIQLIEKMKKLASNGKGIVTVIHEIPVALEISHKICIVENGKNAFLGTSAEVYDSGIIDKVFGVKLKKTEKDGQEIFYF